MKFVMNTIVAFLLSAMLVYVVSSILGVKFEMATVYFLTVVFAILVPVVGAIIPNEPTPDADHH